MQQDERQEEISQHQAQPCSTPQLLGKTVPSRGGAVRPRGPCRRVRKGGCTHRGVMMAYDHQWLLVALPAAQQQHCSMQAVCVSMVPLNRRPAHTRLTRTLVLLYEPTAKVSASVLSNIMP